MSAASPAAARPPAVYALAGWPLTHSLSPAIHEAAFAAAGIAASYALRPVPSSGLAGFVQDVRTGRLEGANVTVPHKVAVRPLIDEESDLAAATGAVNTLVRTPGGVRGDNTDVAGCFRALAELGALEGGDRPAVVLGAGGIARAATLVLLLVGYRVLVLARRQDQATALVSALDAALPGHHLAGDAWDPQRLPAACAPAALLVQCTPVGARGSPAPCPWPADAPLPAHLTVLDAVAWPLETELVRRARLAGARAAGGLEMLLGQAAAAWRLWTGAGPDLAAMRAAALAAAALAAAGEPARDP